MERTTRRHNCMQLCNHDNYITSSRRCQRRKRQRRHRQSIGNFLFSSFLVLAFVLRILPIGSCYSCSALLMSARLLWKRGHLLSKKSGRGGTTHHRWQCFASTNASEKFTRLPVRNDPKNGTVREDGGVSMTEIELALADGMVLRGQRWTHCPPKQQGGGDDPSYFATGQSTTKILALHGWLDNCRSFHYLAPKLMEKFQQKNPRTTTTTTIANINAEIVAIDLPGHGLSSHKSLDGPSVVLSEGTYFIAEIIDALGWNDAVDDDDDDDETVGKQHHKIKQQQVSLIGHSMGGSMAITYAGVFPEQISRVVSIDIYGPEPGNPEQAASNIRSHVSQRRSSMGPKGKPHALYPSLERATERRQKAATMAPGGNQYLSLEAAKELVTRSMDPVYESDNYVNDNDTSSIKGYRFKHDARLLWQSLQYLTIEQIQSILERVECKVCILAAEDGYPFAQDRIDRVIEALEPEIHKILPGSHHLHADPDTADAVVDTIYDFFCSEDGDDSSSNGEKKK